MPPDDSLKKALALYLNGVPDSASDGALEKLRRDLDAEIASQQFTRAQDVMDIVKGREAAGRHSFPLTRRFVVRAHGSLTSPSRSVIHQGA